MDNLPNDIESLLRLSEAGDPKATLHCAFYYESVNDIPNANRYYELAADAGFADAQFLMGYRLENGINIACDLPRANKYYKMSADNGNGDAQFRLSKNLREGNGIEKDEAEADRYLQLARESHDRAVQKHTPLPDNPDELRKLADEKKDARAMLLVAFDFEGKSDIENANKYYRMSAENGNADAQFLWGMRLEYGVDVEKNEEEAMKWYREAAKNGNRDARARLAQLVEEPQAEDLSLYHAVPDDLEALVALSEKGNHFAGLRAALILDSQQRVEEANKMFVKSATAGNPGAMLILGMRLEHGINVEQDPAQAVEWYARGAQAGNTDSMYRYALCLQNGIGTVADVLEANIWLKRSADMGNQDAQLAFAMNLQMGKGVEIDEEEARRYLEMAKKG